MQAHVSQDSTMANRHHDRGSVSLRKLLEQLLCEFSRSTSIHGLQHFTHKSRRHPIEHALWVALVAVAAVGAFAVSQAAYQRYLETPSVIAMERDYREWNTSLPAGTLCPHTRVDPIALSRLLSELAANRSAGERAVLGSFLTDLANATYTNFGELRKYLSVPNQLLPPPHRYLDIINKVKMELSFDVSNSLENNAVFSTQTVTELGICWAYNAPFAAYNALSYWQANRWDLLPEGPVVQCHPLSGEVFLQVTNLNSGYQFLLHASSEVADVANRIYASTPALYLSLDLTALSISSSPEAKQLKPSQRRCRLAREPQQQSLAPAYAHSLCRVQCRMRLAHALCGCVPHFYRPLRQYFHVL
ncbi:hypothetical protein B566_EDAN009818 [Ephemera danica]|nr:hypothetical protein B566_EDAN009818 [Ephemera danica]